MKKFLGIVFLSFLFCNMGMATVYEFQKCHKDKYNKWEDFYVKQKLDKIDNHIITINSDANTITRTIFRKKKDVDAVNKYLESVGTTGDFKKMTQLVFNISTFTADIVTGVNKELSDNESIIYERTIYVNLATGEYDIVTKSFYANQTSKKVMPDSEVTFVCDDLVSSGGAQSSSSSGTAFFINKKGNMLTNNHVVDGCKTLSVKYKNKEYDAQLIATDKILDLALLKTEVLPSSFINFSNYNPKKLQKIYVAGYPFGKGLSDDLKISSGIISSLKGVQDNSNELQIDAAINHGNSGGPIVGEGGELIAIAVSGLGKEMSEGINFGIKSSAALNFLGANDIDPTRSNRIKLNNDKLLKILEESTLYISCTY